MTINPAERLIEFGQSVWYDNISRDILQNGELARLISEWGVRGLTSNPTIFEKAIGGSAVYDQQIADLKKKKLSTDQIFEELELADLAAAADLLLPVYEESSGDDGFVSIEVSPLLAADTQGTVEEATRLFERLKRPNVMVKIPGTLAGLPAIRQVLERGINVNVTLLFSVQNYIDVARVYCEALSARLRRGEPITKLRSVASFFVSRVDSAIDAKLDQLINKSADVDIVERAKGVRGKFGIANSKIAYQKFIEIFDGKEFSQLKQNGAKVQRPLWASTGTKDPLYRDVLYVEELIGPHTVNTMPHQTLAAFVDHGKLRESLISGIDQALAVESTLISLGIDVSKIVHELQVDGVKKFSDSFTALNKAIASKLG